MHGGALLAPAVAFLEYNFPTRIPFEQLDLLVPLLLLLLLLLLL